MTEHDTRPDLTVGDSTRRWEAAPEYTVAICTWNRAAQLPLALRSVTEQVGAPDYEVLVVDNGSSDRTKEVLDRMRPNMPQLRWVVETERGLSHARNRALREARGGVVVFLDDDARADPRWLSSYHTALREHSFICAGGPIRLDWSHAPPAWFPPFAMLYLGKLDLGDQVRRLGPGERPRGMNMAVSRDVALSLGGFRASLGRRGGSLLSGDDDEFVDRLRRSGYDIWWQPGASVVHVVDPGRLSGPWLIRRAWMQGLSEVLIEREVAPGTRWTRSLAAATELAKAVAHAAQATVFAVIQPERSGDEVVHGVTALGRAWGQAAAAVGPVPRG